MIHSRLYRNLYRYRNSYERVDIYPIYIRGDDMSMWWDISKSQGYNCLFNFIIGNRGGGKTYGVKKWGIDSFLKTGKQFIYLRRYNTEVENVKDKFFDDISKNYPDVKFEVKGNTFYINDEIAGWIFALSTAKILKSNSFPNVNKIFFDEFIIDKGNYRYLRDEVYNFLEFYETVARMRDDVKVYFLSNAITITNPYFTYFKIHPPKNKTIARVRDDILIEMVNNEEYIKAKKQTRFGKLIEGTQYGRYSIDNVFLRDNDEFVVKKLPPKLSQAFLIKWNGKLYGGWYGEDGVLYMSYKHNPNTNQILAFTTDDHEENTLLMRSNSYLVQMLRKGFAHNLIRFDSISVKNELLPLLERLM